MTEPATKACVRCCVEQPLDQFSRKAATRDAHESHCRSCASAHRARVSAEQRALREAERRAARSPTRAP
jgi:hypothetical protein